MSDLIVSHRVSTTGVVVCPELAAWYAGSAEIFERDDLGLHPAPEGPLRRISLDDVLRDDAAHLRELHRRLVTQGSPKPAAATYLAGWFGGSAARLVGLGLVTAGAALVLRSSEITFAVTAEGWPERTEPGRLGAVVSDGHPWQGQPDVTAVAPEADLASLAATSLRDVLGPLVAACRSLANVRTSSLWEEVADGLGGVLAHQVHTSVDTASLGLLERALAVSGAPWRNVPRLGFAESPVLGEVHVAQKGGCCLAFTERAPDPADEVSSEAGTKPVTDGEALLAAYHARFPEPPGAKGYCSTCRFREPDDVDARQVFWQERRADRTLDRCRPG